MLKIDNENDKKREVHYLINLYNSISEVCKTFGTVEMIEHYGNYMRLKVEKQDKSIGFTFGLVEKLKSKFDINSYSVS